MITSSYTDIIEFFARQKVKDQKQETKEEELDDYVKFLKNTTPCDI